MDEKKTDKRISVVMAAYNAERTIGEAIDSLLAQSWTDWELIVVDDCSTDRTAAIAGSCGDSRVRVLRAEKNRGAAQSRYAGVEAARGEWIAILDSDDCWEPDKLALQMELQRRTGADLLYTGAAFMTAGGERLGTVLHVPERIGYRTLLRQNVISNSSALVRRELYLRYSPQIEELHEDYACWLGLLRDGYTAAGVDRPLLIYRLSQHSKSSNKLRSAKMNWNTLRHCGLGLAESALYMGFYSVNGVRKHAALRAEQSKKKERTP